MDSQQRHEASKTTTISMEKRANVFHRSLLEIPRKTGAGDGGRAGGGGEARRLSREWRQSTNTSIDHW